MELNTFTSYMDSSKLLTSNEYFAGYHYGLRRFHHGETFGENKQIELLKQRGGATAHGVTDGLAGLEPRIYCTQNAGDCSGCSLSSYGRDCHNRALSVL